MSDAEVNALRRDAFKLSSADQYRLAFFVAENVGYVLKPPPSHDDASPEHNYAETLDRKIEFYRLEYENAKTLKMALVAFGAYMALVKLRSEQ